MDDKTSKPDSTSKAIDILASEEISRGYFTNNINVAFGPEDFRMDFFYFTENSGTLNARIILTPCHMKRLFNVIRQNIENYEDKFGPIPEKIEKKSSK